jgi:hypothetical protein
MMCASSRSDWLPQSSDVSESPVKIGLQSGFCLRYALVMFQRSSDSLQHSEMGTYIESHGTAHKEIIEVLKYVRIQELQDGVYAIVKRWS